jgi:elongation factor P hydroxylase
MFSANSAEAKSGDFDFPQPFGSDKVYSRKQFGETGIPSRSGQLREALLYYSTEVGLAGHYFDFAAVAVLRQDFSWKILRDIH